MSQLDPSILGFILVTFGIAATLLTMLLLWAVYRTNAKTSLVTGESSQTDEPDISEGILIVQAGGRIAYINQRAREWFNAWEKIPSLERLSRKIRPAENFLGLCATEGEGQLYLDGRLIRITSYSVPYGESKSVFLAIQPVPSYLEIVPKQLNADMDGISSNAVGILNELGQAMAASLDLELTTFAILDNIGKLIPSESSEITIWDSENRRLSIYRLDGHPGEERSLEKSHIDEPGERAYTKALLGQGLPILENEIELNLGEKISNPNSAVPIRSFLGLPLINAGELIGTLELGSLSTDKYTQNDLEVLKILSSPASIALNNALLYKEEQQRGKELAGLAKLAQAVSTAGETQNLFTHLIHSIASLLDVEYLGFLLFDENRKTLQGQLPFYGLHEDVIEWASAIIQPDSAAENILFSQEVIVAPQAAADPRLQVFGLNNLAVAAGFSHTVLMPVTSSGRFLGYILASDKCDGTQFDQDDLRLLAIIAGQAGPIIENADLIQQSEKRAQRAETLRRIASLTGSSATLDETLKYSLLDLGRLLKADKVGVLLLDEDRGELRLHKSSLFGISPEFASRMGRISTEDPLFDRSVTQSRNYIFSDDIHEDPRLPDLYHPILFSLGLKSVMIAPLVVRDRGIGELLIGSYQSNFFSSGDIQTIITACGQLANVVERSALYAQTDDSLRRRVDQLTSLTRVSRELNTNLDLDYLLRRVYEEVLQTTRADCGSIILFDINDNSSGSSENGRHAWSEIILQLGDPPTDNMHPLESRVLESAEALIIDDYDQIDPTRFDGLEAPVQPIHKGIRSSLVVPIVYQDKIAGLIHIHAKSPHRFDQAAQEISEALALQAAVALGNVYRYQERVNEGEVLNKRVASLARLLQASPTIRSDQSLEVSLEKIAIALGDATQYNHVEISIYDPDKETLQCVAGAGIPNEVWADIKSRENPWEKVQILLKPDFQLGIGYLIPEGGTSVSHDEFYFAAESESIEDLSISEYAWHAHDMLILPLFNQDESPLGMIRVDDPRDHLRPDISTVETLNVFASQVALLIENHRRIQGMRIRMADIQDDLARAQQAVQTAHSHLPILLHKDLEQTIAIQRLSQRAARIRAGMDIAEIVNCQGDRSSVLMIFGRELLTRMDMDIALIVEPGSHGPHLLNSLGRVPQGVHIEALIGQRNPVHQTLQDGSSYLVSRLESDSEWSNSPLLQALDTRGFICIPIFIGARLDSVILAISQTPLPPFTAEDDQLFTLLARLVAITLQNLNLFMEISQHLAEVNLLLDFNRQLSNLEPHRILQTLVESALHVIPTAQASLVVVWDPKQELLVPQAASGYAVEERIMQITYQPGEALPGKAFGIRQAIRIDEVDFPSLYNISSEKLLCYHDATDGLLPISSMAVPLQKAPSSEPLGVLVVENFKAPEAFSIEAQALVTSLTQQTALNLENSRLFRSAEMRANQLQALTGVAAIISSNLQPDELIGSLLDQLEEILPFKTGTLWLRDGEQMFIRVARGFTDSEERTGLSISVEDSALLGEMIDTGQPIVVGDVPNDPRFPALAENPYLSWLGLPLIAGGEVIGVIALEMDEPDFYNKEHLQIATAFAGQSAVALENANLYQQIVSRAVELDQRSQRLEALNRFSNELSSSLDPNELLEITMQEIMDTINYSAVSAVIFDSDAQPVLQAELPLRDQELPITLPDTPLFERLRQTLGSYTCEDVAADEELAPIVDVLTASGTRSLLALSLFTGTTLHGILMVHADKPYHFTADEIGIVKTISNQASIAIQNARLYAETHSLTNELDQRVRERTEQLARAHQRTEILLRLITELSASLDLEQVLTRTLKVLNQIIDAEHITVLLARTGEKKLHHLASVGYQTPLTTDEFFTSLDPDQGLAGWIIQQRKPVLIPDVREDFRWLQLPNSTTEYRSAIGVPLLIGGVSLGALLFFHRKVAHFSLDQLDLVQAAANQVAIAVNNAELYRLIRDQAEDLGSMVRKQQIETQRTKAMLEDVADGVLVTDENIKIALFNDSAEKILGLNRSNVIGKSLEHFIGLFGSAAQTWMDTIRMWSQNPDTYKPGDTYAEQIDLDDGRVVSVHLAPVSLRDTFLGTVSTFRDITHQVEVDRLKSEFVATVSHELRTPMTSIKGYVDILLMGAAGPLSEQQSHFLEIVKSNSERLAILVNDLLDISRIESGRLNLSVQPLDIVPLAREIIGDLTRRTQEDNKHMHIETDLPRMLPRVVGDPEQVRRILDNLLENAYYYTAENGHISLRIRQVDEYLQIDVQDTGIGIPLDLQPRVFERFYRGEHPFVLATSGTGLGLSIVKHLVDMHKGKIWLESSGVPGEGSTFSFTLPIHSADI